MTDVTQPSGESEGNVHIPGFPGMSPTGEGFTTLNPFASDYVPEATEKLEGMTVYNHDAVVVSLVRSQVDYHFSDTNLSMDNYLLSRMHEDPDYWVDISVVAKLTKISQLTDDERVVRLAIEESDLLVLNEDKTKTKRPGYIPPKPSSNPDLRRSVFVYGLGPDITLAHVEAICSEFGVLKKVVFEGCADGPDKEVSTIIMAKKFGPRVEIVSPNAEPPSPVGHPLVNPNGDETDFSHLRSCFVVFESQSQSNKLVKARSRAVDGLRAMHLYDFNKARKKIASAKARGVSPIFSPKTSFFSSSRSNSTSGAFSPLFEPTTPVLVQDPPFDFGEARFSEPAPEVVRPNHILDSRPRSQSQAAAMSAKSNNSSRFPKPSSKFRLSQTTTNKSARNSRSSQNGRSFSSRNSKQNQSARQKSRFSFHIQTGATPRTSSGSQRVVGRTSSSGNEGGTSARSSTGHGRNPPAPTPKFATPSAHVLKKMPSLPVQFQIAAKARDQIQEMAWSSQRSSVDKTDSGRHVAVIHPVPIRSNSNVA